MWVSDLKSWFLCTGWVDGCECHQMRYWKEKKNNRFEEITQHLDVSIMIVIKLHS